MSEYAIIPVSSATYWEIRGAIEQAGLNQRLKEEQDEHGPITVIDMQGLALAEIIPG
jgi:hypothetical protein